jgi:hypothetical protein
MKKMNRVVHSWRLHDWTTLSLGELCLGQPGSIGCCLLLLLMWWRACWAAGGS